MAAPLGNHNAAKGTLWRDALRMELAKDKKRIRRLIAALLDKGETGDVTALKEIADRLDGKPTQALEHSGAIQVTKVEHTIVRAK